MHPALTARVGTNTTIEVPRPAGVVVTVWLLQESGAPLAHVDVPPEKSHVEIARDCRSLRAR